MFWENPTVGFQTLVNLPHNPPSLVLGRYLRMHLLCINQIVIVLVHTEGISYMCTRFLSPSSESRDETALDDVARS